MRPHAYTHAHPLVDAKHNPFYCPAFSARAYMQSLRLRINRRRRPVPYTLYGGRYNKKNADLYDLNNEEFLLSFAKALEEALAPEYGDEDDSEEGGWWIGPICPQDRSSDTLPDSGRREWPAPPTWERNASEKSSQGPVSSAVPLASPFLTAQSPAPSPSLTKMSGQRTTMAFSDLKGPSVYSRSFQSVHESSFEIEVRREKLNYTANDSQCCSSSTGPPSRISATSMDLGTENLKHLHAFIDQLDLSIIPGIRLKERLLAYLDAAPAGEGMHQTVATYLADHGHLSSRVLDELGKKKGILRLDMSESMVDEGGLNICEKEFFSVFGKPNNFLSLTELSFSGIRVEDSYLAHIHHLPKLSTLLLNNTGIGNEAVFLLVPLKDTLRQLSLATNPHIDDDAIPALILLSKLYFLSILDTSIEIPGLRRLARAMSSEGRTLDVEIPSACELYVDSMHTKYLLDPIPPLVTNPDICSQLTSTALQRNLAAHAAVNPEILPGGAKAEMVARLEGILSMRQADLVVRGMLSQKDGELDSRSRELTAELEVTDEVNSG